MSELTDAEKAALADVIAWDRGDDLMPLWVAENWLWDSPFALETDLPLGTARFYMVIS